MSDSRDSWGKNYDQVNINVVSLAYPRQVEEQDNNLKSMVFDSALSTSRTQAESQHPLIEGASPPAVSADVLLTRPHQYHRRTVTDTPLTPSAPLTVYGCPIYNLSGSFSPPLSCDTPNTTVFDACPTRSSLESFASSPPDRASPTFQSPFARPVTRARVHIYRIPSEDCRALSIGRSPWSMSATGSRGTMILYRLPAVNDATLLLPRPSIMCTLGDSESMVSFSPDSRYPVRPMMMTRSLEAYVYDPSKDDETDDGMDLKEWKHEGGTLSWRGIINVGGLVALIGALLCLFLFYPVYRAFADSGDNARTTHNTRINVTEQVESWSFDTRAGVWEAGTHTT